MLDWILATGGILLWMVGFGTYIWHKQLIELWARIRKPGGGAV